MWHQKGTTEKPIISIQSANRPPFPGYENVVLSFEQLENVVENHVDYLIALVRCDMDETEALVEIGAGKYADEIDIPICDTEEEYLEEQEYEAEGEDEEE